ncbi:hypothetical protein ACHAXS_009025 [Conticribra weissflogii]
MKSVTHVSIRRLVSCQLNGVSVLSTSLIRCHTFPPSIDLSRRRHVTDSSRLHSSPATASKDPVLVPPPTSWSVRDLRLTSSTADGTPQTISEEELDTLARRCLIDVRRLSSGRRDRLRKDIAGIMRCASVLLDATSLHNHENNKMTDVDIYDAPRGLGKLPIRRDDDGNGDDWVRDSGESRAVMKGESVKRKLIEKDGDLFFSVMTKG